MITSSTIAWGDQLGAQLSKIAQLLYIAKENGQEICFFDELKHYRRTYQFLEVFDAPDWMNIIQRASPSKKKIIEKYCETSGVNANWKQKMDRIYNNKVLRYVDRFFYEWARFDYRDFIRMKGYKNGVHTDERLLNLRADCNYDILDGFGTFQDWGKYKEIIQNLRFKEDVKMAGDKIMSLWGKNDKKKVAVHFRRTDYLLLSSLNLSEQYYMEAFKYFDAEKTQFIVFSDDIEYCKSSELFKGKDTFFVEGNSAGTDMYLMTQCDGNIIANSTFSFWGAFLNLNRTKTVVCPHDFIGQEAKDVLYINGNYYPKDWIAI